VKDDKGYFVIGKKEESVWLCFSDHPTSWFDSPGALQNGCSLSTMRTPHDPAGNMRIMIMNLVQISPFLHGMLLALQLFKVMLILERLMIAEMCTSAPGISQRADRTSNV